MVTFLLSYLTVTVKFSKTQSLVVLLVILVAAVIGGVLAGYLIDVVGRKRIAVVSALGVGVWAVPTFAFLEHSTVLGACLVGAVLAFFAGGIRTTTLLAVVELFPPGVRSSASTLAYQIGLAVFGGTTP
ncbi:MFS transporter [Streptomyces rugosispiralis]|uniref:MFS transporter n=1 Tax=Streptomyces rugosispiralis TaxID=2967341 RepID=A0ABT1V5M7_9ACTN|nr:MFS transporter [Streptomyces rugosispiralis]MCQ8192700.1 MFS transporter [Streptomyces rugosispiralis]